MSTRATDHLLTVRAQPQELFHVMAVRVTPLEVDKCQQLSQPTSTRARGPSLPLVNQPKGQDLPRALMGAHRVHPKVGYGSAVIWRRRSRPWSEPVCTGTRAWSALIQATSFLSAAPAGARWQPIPEGTGACTCFSGLAVLEL